MMKKIVATISVGFILLAGCENAGSFFGRKQDGRPERAPKGGVESIVISQSVPLYASATDTGQQIATLSLGETVYWTQDSARGQEGDTTLYLRAVLSDGATGWVQSPALVRSAQAAAIRKETRVYRRPDTLTLTDVRMPFMGMIAITDRTDDWVRVIGESRDATGWIRKDVITEEKDDVATAIFARQKIIIGDAESRTKLLEDIIFNAPYANSYFIEQLNHMRSLESLFEKEAQKAAQTGRTESGWFSSPEQAADTADWQ